MTKPFPIEDPAKVARGLAHRIYRHLLDRGYVTEGQTILDPFCGIGGFALDALTYGLRFIGCELEPRFHALSLQNAALWQRQYGLTGATFFCGDSRHLRAVLGEAGVECCVSSPPYMGSTAAAGDQASDPSFKWINGERSDRGKINTTNFRGAGYGTTPGQLGQMRVEAVVTSPPYVGSVHDGNGIDQTKLTGNTPGRHTQATAEGYGVTHGQLGVAPPDTFWSAASAILTEVHALLKPNGIAAWVVKGYISKGRLVDFPAQWLALCQHHGFTLVEEIHASLVEEHGVQGSFLRQEGPPRKPDTLEPYDPMGYLIDESTYVVETSFNASKTERKSFFRRLAEKKGSPRIDHETILIVQKGRGAAGEADAIVTSPPYGKGLSKEHTYADHAKREKDSHRGIMTEKGITDPFYGTTPGQLGSLPTGTLDAIVSSPPYGDGQVGTGKDGRTGWRGYTDIGGGTSATPGQIASLPTGTLDAIVASPPYAASGKPDARDLHFDNQRMPDGRTRREASIAKKQAKGVLDTYGTTPGQLGSLPTGNLDTLLEGT